MTPTSRNRCESAAKHVCTRVSRAGRKFQPHFTDLFGFTFPNVQQVLDEMGRLPMAIERIQPPFRNSLVGTLACELASVAAQIISRGRSPLREFEIERSLLWELGGTRYRSASVEADKVFEAEQKARRKERLLERASAFLSDRFLEAGPQRIVGSGAQGDLVRWRYDLHPAEEIDALRRDISELLKEGNSLKERCIAIDTTLQNLKSQIAKTGAYQTVFESERRRKLVADFCSTLEYQDTGAAYFLRNSELGWWNDFIYRFQKKANAAEALRQIALRDPIVVQKIELRLMTETWDGAAADYLKALVDRSISDVNYWGIRQPTTILRIKSARQVLRSQDRSGMEWLKKLGRHSNPYTIWLADYHHRSVAVRERLENNLYNLDFQWIGDLAHLYVPESLVENIDWRQNELSWCLSRRNPGIYRFVPLTSGRQDRDEWEQHLKAWWNAIEAAQTGKSI